MSNPLKELSPSQQEAVKHETGPLLIIAGPGSGKTRTVVRSIAYAIEKGEQPDQILAFSFTVKASQELKEQVTDFVDEEKANLVQISTFHSFCRKVLKEDIGQLHRGNALNSQDLDEDEQEKEDRRRVAQAINDLQYESVKLEDVHNFIIKCKLGVLPSNAGNSKYVEIYDRYEQRLKEDGWIDYPNQLLFTDELFRDVPKVKKKWQQQFNLIFVDEYQDTDPVQYRIIKALAEEHQNLRVVGDDDQGIYGWRGADIQNILNFENDYPTDNKPIILGQNYRSTQRIVETSRALVEFNPDRRDKELFTRNLKGEKVIHLHCENDDVEAETIAAFISRAIKEGRNPSDFAVLYRINKQAKPFETAFKNFEIPFHEVKQSSDRDVHGVSIMTIHKSKGLEFPNVFVVGVCKDLLPNYYSREEKDWGEELRLLYVAMTRAKNWLCLSSYDYYQKYERGQSPFLERGYIPSSLLKSVETLKKTDTPPIPEEMSVQNAVEQSDAPVEPLPISPQTVIGIDPGNIGAKTTNVGWSVTQKSADGYSVLCFDTENPEGTHEDRLQEIKQKIDELIVEYKPDAIAIERLKISTQEEIKDWFSHVAGCVVQIGSIASEHGIERHLYTQQQVKYAATGKRKASKEDVQKAVKRMCNLPQIPEPHHSADAIAASLCYLRSYLNSARFEGNKRKQKQYEAGCDYFDKKQYETAIGIFKETINIDPIYTDAHCGLGRAYLAQGNLEAAENAAKKSLKLAESNHPDSQKLLDAIVHYRSGCNAINNKQFNEAITEFQKSINLEPIFLDAYSRLSRAHLGLSNLEIAKNLVEEALKLADDYPPIQQLSHTIKLYNAGLNFLNDRRYNDAIDKFQETIDRDPIFTEAHYSLGCVYFQSEALESAEQSANDTLELNINHQLARALLEDIKEAYVDKGDDALERLDLTEAEKYTNKAFHIDRDCQLAHKLSESIKQAYYKRGLNHLNNQQYDAAIAAFEKTVNRYPKFIEAHCGLGQAYLKKEDLAAAENSANEALRLDKNYRPALELRETIAQKHYELARDCLNQDNLAAAENSANEALRLVPDYKSALELLEGIRQAYYKRGIAPLNKQEYDEAIAAFEETINRYPKFTEAHYELGWAYLGKRNLAAAENSANEALRLDENYRPALELRETIAQKHYELARDCLNQDNLAAAEISAKEALRLAPDYQPPHAVLEDIKQKCYNQGCDHLDNQRYNEAIEAFTKTINKYPNFAPAHCGLAQTHLKQGDDLTAAEESVKEARRVAPNYQPLHAVLDDIKQEYHNRGIACIEDGVKCHPLFRP